MAPAGRSTVVLEVGRGTSRRALGSRAYFFLCVRAKIEARMRRGNRRLRDAMTQAACRDVGRNFNRYFIRQSISPRKFRRLQPVYI